MYRMSRQSSDGFTTLAADLLSDKSGEVFLALQDSLSKARQEVGIDTGVDRETDVGSRLATAFDAAERILASARDAQLTRS